MKKVVLCMLLCLLVAAAALADESTDGLCKRKAQAMLTEVYGYTQAEADAFTFEVTDNGGYWTVRYYQNPDWAYTVDINKDDEGMYNGQTPFSTLHSSKAPENFVRAMLGAVEENGWFDDWNAESKAAFRELIDWFGDIKMNESMQNGLLADDYTPAQVLEDFFLSCYGEKALWSEALTQWYDAVVATFGFTAAETAFVTPQGVTYSMDTIYNGAVEIQVCEFTGEVPAELAEAFSHPNLAGWDCMAGAYYVTEPNVYTDSPQGYGLAVFENGEQRMLVMLYQEQNEDTWHVLPVGAAALLPGRSLYITCDGSRGDLTIVYPISDTERESFQCYCRVMSTDPTLRIGCELEEYRYENRSENKVVTVAYILRDPYSSYYRVTTAQNGVEEVAQYVAFASNLLDYTDASDYPKTDAECEVAAQAAAVLPEGYGMSANVHLRAKATSHSADLGMYRMGTLVEVLGTEPGGDFPWVHVRIATAEGYMSSNYVAYDGGPLQVLQYSATGMAVTLKEAALKENTGTFAGTVVNLPAGTVVRVLAETGSWLHVSIPEDADDWLMRPGETSGYIKMNAVVQAETALQLSWLLAEE